MTETHPSSAALVARLGASEQAALARLTQVSGQASLCAMSRSGSPQPAAKYHEGAAVALAEARRAAAGPVGQPDARASVETTRQTWARRLAGVAPDAPDWRAYLQGGVDALEEALAPPRVAAFSSPEALVIREAPALREALVPPATRSSNPWDLVRDAFAPPRRRTALTVVAPILFGVFALTGGIQGAPAGRLLLVAAVSFLLAVIIATYVPERGWRPDLGCGPCGVVTAGAVLLAGALVIGTPQGTTMVAAALAVALFGVFQRLTKGMDSCSA